MLTSPLVEPGRDVSGVVGPRLRRQRQVGAQERRPKLGHQLLGRVRLLAEPAPQVPRAPASAAGARVGTLAGLLAELALRLVRVLVLFMVVSPCLAAEAAPLLPCPSARPGREGCACRRARPGCAGRVAHGHAIRGGPAVL